jgi:DNA repair photolyase
MRWDNLRLDEPLGTGDGRDLFAASAPPLAVPLIERGAVARTFDTPGFRGMTFYEVHAKSVVNRVPEASRMPFRWTINPYRGCQHACVYCLEGETPILMADGRTRPLADLRPGDAIYGTTRRGGRREYVRTTVLAHWSTVKPAYRVVLADGTRLVCSGDHRFLAERGWRYVTGAAFGALRRRPSLSAGHALMGPGGFAEPPKQAAAYRRGYLCGLIRGDGNVGHYSYPQRLPAADRSYLFGLALAEPGSAEARARTVDYLARAGIGCTDFVLTEDGQRGERGSPEPGRRRQVTAIRTVGPDQARTLERLMSWPDHPGADWHKGFLAGFFDARGSYRDGILRVYPADPEIGGWLLYSLQSLGLDAVVERPHTPGRPAWVRLGDGIGQALRFFHAVDPASTARRSIEGAAVGTCDGLRVEAIERLGLDVPMYDLTTGTGDFIANGVVSHNCFARKSHTYLDLDTGADFNSKVVVKVNAPELVRKKLTSPSWAGEHIAVGMNVDCYQRAEGRYQLMPGIIRALRDAANPFSILTKGTLIVRDADLLAEAADVTEVGLNVSAGFVDKDLWRSIEPGTPAPERRLEACATLNKRGLRCGVLMGPVVPFLSDSPAQLDKTVRQIAAAGAGHVAPIVLHLRPGTREWFFTWLRARHPELTNRYLELYGGGAYAPKAYQNRIAGQVRELAEKYGIGQPRPGSARGTPPRTAGRPATVPGPQASMAPSPLSAAGSLTASDRPIPRPPKVPAAPAVPAVPGVSGIPAVPGVSGVPAVPGVSGVPAPCRRSPAPPEQLTLL